MYVQKYTYESILSAKWVHKGIASPVAVPFAVFPSVSASVPVPAVKRVVQGVWVVVEGDVRGAAAAANKAVPGPDQSLP